MDSFLVVYIVTKGSEIMLFVINSNMGQST